MKHYEAIIIGKGPAGLSCAIYALRAGVETLVIAKDGGALAKTHELENYYGFPEPIAGPDLLERGIKQVQRLNCPIIEDELTGLNYTGVYELSLKSGAKYTADNIFFGTGASRATPFIKNLASYEGKGISYCAVCDGFFFRGKELAVLGKGAYALHEAQELLPLASKVTILTNGDEPEIAFPEEFQVNKEKIAEVKGQDTLEEIVFKDGSSLKVNGLFMAVGTAGAADFAKKLGIAINGKKIVVDSNNQSNLPGIFAGGDCTEGVMQVAKAVYDGANAAAAIIKNVRAKRKKA